MKIGVIGIKDGWSSRVLADALAEKTGSRHLIDMSEAVFDTRAGTVYCGGHDLSSFDAFAVKKIGAVYSPALLDRLEMLVFLEKKGIRFFSGAEKIIRLIDRLSCTATLASSGALLPATIVTSCPELAEAAVKKFGKAVLKPLYTSKGKGMSVVEDGRELRGKLQGFLDAGNDFFYVQKFLEIPEKDFGVVFLGGRYLTTYSRVKMEGSWSTTTASGGRYMPYDPPENIIEEARKAQEPFGLDFTCVDMAESKGSTYVFEVSAFGGFRGIMEARGMDAAALYADYIINEVSK